MYKRQVQARQRYYAVCERLLWSQFDALVRPGFDYNANLAGAVGKQSGAAPVSYTHLDVYKRQAEVCGRAFRILRR